MKYDDIIGIPHWDPQFHPRMNASDRAAQFAPFAALTGYYAMVGETARLTDRKVELDEEQILSLNEAFTSVMDRLCEHPAVAVRWFRKDAVKSGGSYVLTEGVVKTIDMVNRLMILKDSVTIPLDDVFSVREL